MAKKKAKPIDVDSIDLDKLKEFTTDNPGLVPYAHSVGGAVVRPDDMNLVKSRAQKAMEEHASQQMGQIVEQIKLLAKQAEKIKKNVEISKDIYQAEIGFEPVIGETYYLYQKNKKTKLVSLIAPEEWGQNNQYEFIAKIKLLADRTWQVLDSEN